MASSIIGNNIIISEATIEQDCIHKPESSRLLQQDINLPSIDKKKAFLQKYLPFNLDELVWRNIIIFCYFHTAALYGIYLLLSRQAKLSTFVISYMYAFFGALGITAGAHRLWSHRSYKATWQLRLILVVANCIAFQNCVYEWVRDHRVHHKFTDTNADPHNVNRGFFFSHVGWLLMKKHPDVKIKGQTVDMSDLEADAIVMFQKKHYMKIMPLLCFIIPTMIAFFFNNETLSNAWYVAGIMRYVLSLHATWAVNSAAHIWGMKPYDKTIKSANNIFVASVALGEGFHNYHHVFPWDYKTAELGDYSLNATTAFIDFFSKIGWAYDLKTVSPDLIKKRAARTGDGSNKFSKCIEKNSHMSISKEQTLHHNLDSENLIWGWDDNDLTEQDKQAALILSKVDKFQ